MVNATPQDIEGLRTSGRIAATALRALVDALEPGITTAELDRMAEEHIRRAGAIPPFRGYRDYPATICTSINDHIVHGLPSASEKVAAGDIIGLDIGADFHGYITDMAVTVPVGTVRPEAKKLLAVTQEALRKAIAFVRPGKTIGDLGAMIQAYVEREGFSVIRDLVGHGVGRELHEDPMIPNFGTPGQGKPFTEGMVVAIEPMVSTGDWHVKTLKDGWTVAMRDGSLGAHFEHTVAITRKGTIVLTQTNGSAPWP